MSWWRYRYPYRCAVAVVAGFVLAANGAARVHGAEVARVGVAQDDADNKPDLSAPRRTAVSGVRIASWDLHDLWHQANVPLRAGTTVRSSADFRALREKARSLRADVIALQGIGSPRAARMLFPARQYFVIFSRELAIRQQKDRDILSNPARRRVYNAIAVRRAAKLRILAREQVLETADPSPSLGEGRPQGQSALAVKLRINKRPVWVVTSRLLRGCDAQAKGKVASGEANPNANPKLGKKTSAACTAMRDQALVLNAWKSRKVTKQDSVVLAMSVPDDARALSGNATMQAAWHVLTTSDPVKVTVAYNARRRAETRRRGFVKQFVLTNPIVGAAQASVRSVRQPRTVPLTGPSRPAGQRLVKQGTERGTGKSNFVVDALSDFAKAALGEKSEQSKSLKKPADGDALTLAELSETGLAKLAVASVPDVGTKASKPDATRAATPTRAPTAQANATFIRYPQGAASSGCSEQRRGSNFLLIDRAFHKASQGLEYGASFASDADMSIGDGAKTDCAAVITVPRTAS